MKNHKDLVVWKEAVGHSVICYGMTRRLLREQQFGLVSWMQRAAISTANNVADGAARANNKELIQSLYVSLGFAGELDTQIQITKRIRLGEPSD